MKLEYPLAGLFDRCQTLCLAECCGIEAYDLIPIHIASFLLMGRGTVDTAQVSLLHSQLTALKTNYGSQGRSGPGVTLDDLNQIFSGVEIDALVEKIYVNLDAALALAAATHSSIGANAV